MTQLSRNCRSFWANLQCSLCGKEGDWVFIPFVESGEHISRRPSDCAAILITDEDVPFDISLHTSSLDQDGVNYDTFCPDCYRIGGSPEENGLTTTAFDGLTRDDVYISHNTTFDREKVGERELEDMVKKVVGFHDLGWKAVFSEEENGGLGIHFFLGSTTSQGVHFNFNYLAEHRHGTNDLISELTHELRWGGSRYADSNPCTLWSQEIPEDLRVTVFTQLFQFYLLIHNRFSEKKVQLKTEAEEQSRADIENLIDEFFNRREQERDNQNDWMTHLSKSFNNSKW